MIKLLCNILIILLKSKWYSKVQWGIRKITRILRKKQSDPLFLWHSVDILMEIRQETQNKLIIGIAGMQNTNASFLPCRNQFIFSIRGLNGEKKS